jgi:hypothetical protein
VLAGGDSQSTWERTCSLCNAADRLRARTWTEVDVSKAHFDGELEKVTRELTAHGSSPFR